MNTLLYILMLILFATPAIILIFSPEKFFKVIGLWSRFVYRDLFGMNDEQVDSLPKLGGGEKHSDIVHYMIEDPEMLGNKLILARLFGILLLLIVALMACPLLIFGPS